MGIAQIWLPFLFSPYDYLRQTLMYLNKVVVVAVVGC